MAYQRPSEFAKDANMNIGLLFALFDHGFPKTATRKGLLLIDEDKGHLWLRRNGALLSRIQEELLAERAQSELDESSASHGSDCDD